MLLNNSLIVQYGSLGSKQTPTITTRASNWTTATVGQGWSGQMSACSDLNFLVASSDGPQPKSDGLQPESFLLLRSFKGIPSLSRHSHSTMIHPLGGATVRRRSPHPTCAASDSASVAKAVSALVR